MGDFSKSCSNIQLDGTVLSADCRRIDGSSFPASIDLNAYVSNQDGVLELDGNGFAFSSENVGLSSNILSASCKRINGDFSSSSLDLNARLTNRDGVLQVE